MRSFKRLLCWVAYDLEMHRRSSKCRETEVPVRSEECPPIFFGHFDPSEGGACQLRLLLSWTRENMKLCSPHFDEAEVGGLW